MISGSVSVEQCSFSNNAEGGIQAWGIAHVDVKGSHCRNNGLAGYLVQGPFATLTMDSCSSNSDERGCLVSQASVAAQHTEFINCTLQAVLVEGEVELLKTFKLATSAAVGKAAASLTDCTASKCSQQAVVVKGKESVLSMFGGRLSEAEHNCVEVLEGARACLERVTVGQSAGGSGVVAAGQGTRVQLKGCTLRQNAGHGAVVLEGAELTLQNTQSLRNNQGQYHAEDSAQMCVVDGAGD